ncbi:MAG TPA: hypothetical protein VNU19_03320 [Candidatus Acidoferrum sp.]|nr:hypothetical protein [Candidatus Acidoferrum sp.]
MKSSVEAPHARPAVDRPLTPSWLWVALLAGAVVTIWWAWFASGFMSEPSAVGRVRIALWTSIFLSALSGLAGAGGALALLRRAPWGRPLAWVASVTLTLSGAGAIGGIPALVGLLWSRKPATP